jgi:transcriptional regulator with XRE-family HTH domain
MKTQTSDIFDQLMEIVESDPASMTEYRVELLRIALSLSLKKVREHSGRTQQQIAEFLKVQQPWISKMESCNNDHTFESIAKYIFAMGAEIALEATFEDGTQIELASSKRDGARKYRAGNVSKLITFIGEMEPTVDWSNFEQPALNPEKDKGTRNYWDSYGASA